jgi:hypothetical protein
VKSTKQIVVTKQDGTLERFSLAKLTNCLASAMRNLAYDPRLAGPLARAVAMHLQDTTEPGPPTTDYVYRCARAVLQQTGLVDVADVLASHRRLRTVRRHRIRVVESAAPGARSAPWRKSALVETLQADHGLRRAVARFVAGRIEAQVFALDYRSVSRSFLAELMRSELMAWGLVDAKVYRVNAAPSAPPVGAHRPEEEK